MGWVRWNRRTPKVVRSSLPSATPPGLWTHSEGFPGYRFATPTGCNASGVRAGAPISECRRTKTAREDTHPTDRAGLGQGLNVIRVMASLVVAANQPPYSIR